MRKQSLRQQANVYFTSPQGSYREKKYRRYVILKMINDLFTTGMLPQRWQVLNATHLQLLVNHWYRQKISPSTMMNYMTIIRKFLVYFDNNLTNIDNQSLGIINLPSKKRTPIALEKWQQIDDPLARLLLNLQIHFGLTLSEIMHLLPGVHVQKNYLWLTREMTFISLDRIVPIRSETQINIINEFNLITKNRHRLVELYGYRALCFTWSKALKAARIPVKRSCRYLYAQLIYKQLAPTQGNDELTKLLMRELGLKSRTTLWGYLRHVNDKPSGKKLA